MHIKKGRGKAGARLVGLAPAVYQEWFEKAYRSASKQDGFTRVSFSSTLGMVLPTWVLWHPTTDTAMPT